MTTRVFKVVLLPLLFLGARTTGQDSEPRKVFISVCRLDGAVQPCDNFQIKVRAEHRVVEVRQFAHNDGRGGFLIPDEFESAKTLDLIVETPTGGFELGQLDASWWRDTWELGLEQRPFSEDYGYVYRKKKTKCFGYVVYVNSEPGRVISTTNCK